jgi:glutamate N-acetyltransferase/amino-acid N-acetyltransferase
VAGGGTTTAKGFRAAGMYASLRSRGTRPDLGLVLADKPAVVGGTFTTNVMCAAPVTYCKQVRGVAFSRVAHLT